MADISATSWIPVKRGIQLSSAEVDELQNEKGIQRIRAFFQSKFSGFEASDSITRDIRNCILTVRNSRLQTPFSSKTPWSTKY